MLFKKENEIINDNDEWQKMLRSLETREDKGIEELQKILRMPKISEGYEEIKNIERNPYKWFKSIKEAFIQGNKPPLSRKDAKKYIIINIFNIIDMQIQFLFAEKYFIDGSENPLFDEFREMIFPKFGIREKIKILKHYGFSGKLPKILTSVNEVRNGVAHGYGLDHKKFLYPEQNGGNIFLNSSTFRAFLDDCEKVYYWLYDKFMEALNTRYKDRKE